jgi:hypothetical protein
VIESYWAETADGERHQCATPSAAWAILINLRKQGRIVCQNRIDDNSPSTWTVIDRDPDGYWSEIPSPITVV